MKTHLFVLISLLLFVLHPLSAQKNPADSKRSSSDLYIYKANVEDLRQIQLKGESPDENMLQSFVTSFPKGKKTPSLPRGNYFIVKAEENQLIFDEHIIDDLNFKIIPGEKMMLCLYDSLGNIISNAKVKSGRSELQFDKNTGTYNTGKVKDEQVIEINNNNVFHYIEIEDPYSYYTKSNAFKKNWMKVKYKWISFKYDIVALFNPDERPTKNKYTGFIVFSKPKYKPGETVKFKAYLSDYNNNPYNKPVNIKLSDNYPYKTDTILVKGLSPYRPGMYQYEFGLTDSLDLQLDKLYNITLITNDKNSNRLTDRFKYEEYELKSTHFSIETEKEKYVTGDSIIIKLRATDENNMALYGGKAEIEVTPGMFSEYHMNKMQTAFIPDILWTETIDMSDISEKEIIIPDSIFPSGISIHFDVKCTYLSSDNEKVTQTKKLYRNSNEYVIDFSLEKGILTIQELYEGKSQQTTADIIISGENGEIISDRSVTLPYPLAVPWTTADITVKTKNTTDYFFLDDIEKEQIGYQFFRRNDSIYLHVENPANIPFWYTIRKKKKEITKGYTIQLRYSVKDDGEEGYTMALSYVFGKERHMEESLPFLQKNMSIDVSTPIAVYPGQKVNVTVSVKDNAGKPVENADITAYAFTSKFENYFMPDLQVKGKARYAKPFQNRHYNADENEIYKKKVQMTWERWKHTLSLDTIEYYKFLYPDILYSYSEPSIDGTTQIAPYISIDGALQGVHMLWIDNRLHYVKQAEQLDVYTFRVSPGKHNLRFRTYDREISVHNIVVKEGTKNIMSFDAGIPYIRKEIYSNSVAPFVLVSKLLKKEEFGVLNKNEMDELTGQLIAVNNNFGYIELPNLNKYIELPTYISAGNTNYYLNPMQRTYYNHLLQGKVNTAILAGPFPYRNALNGMSDIATIYTDQKPLTNIQLEGGYTYTLYQDFQKLQSWKKSLINRHIHAYTPDVNFKIRPLTEKNINSYFNNKITAGLISESGIINSEKVNNKNKDHICNLSLFIGRNEYLSNTIKPALIFIVPQDKDSIHNYRLYYGGTRELRNLPAGNMDIHFIFGDTTCYTMPVTLYKDGRNYLHIDSIHKNTDNEPALTAFRLLERNLIKVQNKNPYVGRTSSPAKSISPQQAGEFKMNNELKNIISGTVRDEFGEPLIGASVSIQGSSSGIITDFDGYFELSEGNDGDKIKVTYLGYIPVEIRYKEGYDYNIVLIEDSVALEETVVIGYGTQKKSNLTGSISTIDFDGNLITDQLMGKVAGIMVRGSGISSTNETSPPLIIINGLPYNGNLEDLDPNTIKSLNILKGQEATAIYGSRGANGVIMIQTDALGKSMGTQQAENESGTTEPGNSIRRNFHDDAFWQPSLRTNEKGEVSFEVTYPDDITSWNAYFLAIGNRKQSDKKQMTIQSFKALTARLSLPRFAIRGDSLNAIGRIANHLNDTIQVSQTVTIGNEEQVKVINMSTSYVEQIPVTVTNDDSLTITYSLQMPNGYFDGEERSIPVFEQGLLDTFGEFKIINDTSTTMLNINPDLGTTTIYAEASSLEAFLREIEKVDRYPYLCNEQMASKIKALLSKKRIADIFGKEFKEDKKINDLINRLNNNRNKERLWGWWNKDKTEFWISKQVLSALLDAEDAGYKINMDKSRLCLILEDELVNALYALPMRTPSVLPFFNQELYDRLILLKRLEAPIDYPAYYAKISQQTKSHTVTSKLKEMQLLSIIELNDEIRIDSLMQYSQETMLGSLFWNQVKPIGYPGYFMHPYDNHIENTLIAYSILKKMGGYEAELKKIQNYFFECRHAGSWQNTYESSRIIETIMPDLLDQNTTYSKTSMTINDKKISSFPFTEKIETKQPIRIKKEGTLPLFITVYQQEWNRNPQPESSKGFSVQTFFLESRDTVSYLKAGKTIQLEVNVKVDAQAEYVQIEVPIPAGCTYESKRSNYYGKEVHREYFKEKVTIFCNQLSKGEHSFSIELIPRYTGKYILNPAKVELMYFPVFYGNEKVKITKIH